MTYHIDHFGCAKNQVDAENMMSFLNLAGWSAAESAETADLIIVNSCGFIESAKQESINAVLGWRELYPNKKILLTGCLAERYAKELREALPEADGIFGVSDISGITQAAFDTMQTSLYSGNTADRNISETPSQKLSGSQRISGPTPQGQRSEGSRPLLSMPGSAYVKISEGCNNRCSFCAIPLIRGDLRSRPVSAILKECKELLGRGIRELCLVGQDSGSYGNDFTPIKSAGTTQAHDLSYLLGELSRLKGNFWVRLLYIHPDHFPLPILDIIDRDKRFLPYFDIPFQHGSEKILRSMNRRQSAEANLELIRTIRMKLPDAVIRSTFMTGFPSETEEDFRLLLDFQEKACLDWLGCFTFSREENTPAWDLKCRVDKKTAVKRKQLIEEHQISITEKQMERFIGRVLDVLVEEKYEPLTNDSSETALYLGRLPCHAPEVDGAAVIFSCRPLQLGSMVSCRVTARTGFDLKVQVL